MAGEDFAVAARTVARMPSRLYCELRGFDGLVDVWGAVGDMWRG